MCLKVIECLSVNSLKDFLIFKIKNYDKTYIFGYSTFVYKHSINQLLIVVIALSD